MSVSKWPPFFFFVVHRIYAGGESHNSGVSGDGVHWILREAHSHSNQQYHHGRLTRLYWTYKALREGQTFRQTAQVAGGTMAVMRLLGSDALVFDVQ